MICRLGQKSTSPMKTYNCSWWFHFGQIWKSAEKGRKAFNNTPSAPISPKFPPPLWQMRTKQAPTAQTALEQTLWWRFCKSFGFVQHSATLRHLISLCHTRGVPPLSPRLYATGLTWSAVLVHILWFTKCWAFIERLSPVDPEDGLNFLLQMGNFEANPCHICSKCVVCVASLSAMASLARFTELLYQFMLTLRFGSSSLDVSLTSQALPMSIQCP